MNCLISAVKFYGNVLIQLSNNTRHPIDFGSIYTMPQRDTVAGLAACKSIGSKIRFIDLLMAMIYPELRHSFLLSSSTVFMFSIQTASTGPSKMSHLRLGSYALAKFLNLTASTPSVH
jgi:hypothetical protein